MIKFDPKNIIYCPLDLSVPSIDVHNILQELNKSTYFHSPYRTCQMIPIYTQGGKSKREEILKYISNDLHWTQESLKSPTLIKVLKNIFFPICKPLPRVFILSSKPHGEVKLHIDCNQKGISQQQHKLRLVLSGHKKGLWFLGEKNERIHISGMHSVYMIDGSAPHGMLNNSIEDKLTVCLGAPWNGTGNETYLKLLESSYSKFYEHVIHRKEISSNRPSYLFQKNIEKQLLLGLDPRDQITYKS